MATGNLLIRSPEGHEARPAMPELLMAWARDRATGEPRYILELTHAQRGARCGCECPSCGLPLTAVNAAKSEFIKRPHFRHPEGAARSECAVLTARAAVLRQLRDDGWFELPRRRMSGRAVGLSGHTYEVWVDQPAEKVRIASVDFRDRAAAILTLDDGRQLKVQLTGTGGGPNPDLDEDGLAVPTILLLSDDLSLAAMDPAEIRRRLSLIPESIAWRCHWSDLELKVAADAAARDEASKYLDTVPAGLELPAGLDPALRWQTVLHFEVKNILAEACKLMAPAVQQTVEVQSSGGHILRETVVEHAQMLEITHAELEQRFGRVIPDVRCEGWAPSGIWLLPLLIEVTVTNQIDEERLDRIRATDAYAIEIDLSLSGGRLTREELRRLVVDECAMKRWLHFPNFEAEVLEVRRRLEQQVAEEVAELEASRRRQEDWRRSVLATPLRSVAQEYLSSVTALLEAEEGEEGATSIAADSPEQAARERVAEVAEKLSLHGYPEAGDINLIGWHGILSRILSIKKDRGVGYRLDSGQAVLNAIRQSRGVERSNHSIYFIATRAYKPRFTVAQDRWFEEWIQEVKASIRAGEATYLRHPAYDSLLSVLFPEMAAGLAKNFGKRAATELSTKHSRTPPELPERRKAGFLSRQPNSHAAGSLVDTPADAWWLKGRDLEAWRRANPDAARWFGDKK